MQRMRVPRDFQLQFNVLILQKIINNDINTIDLQYNFILSTKNDRLALSIAKSN